MIQTAIKEVKTNWKPVLEKALKHYDKIEPNLLKEKEDFEGLSEIYPKNEDIFSCFNYFDKEELKVIILGQDPYHQPNQAHGLSFSVQDEIKIPPSLKNIFKEMSNDISGDIPISGNLEYLAEQGVLLLNNTFTVRQSAPNSHLKIWKGFTNYLIKEILKTKKDIIFLLWGGNAKKIMECIPDDKIKNNYFLTANHPSPLSANRGGWFGCKHFSKTNEILKEQGKSKIKWLN